MLLHLKGLMGEKVLWGYETQLKHLIYKVKYFDHLYNL